MIKHQQLIYKLTLGFSTSVNLFLLGLLFFVLRDSLSGTGDYFLILQGRSLWYFVGIILAFTSANSFFIFNLFNNQTSVEK